MVRVRRDVPAPRRDPILRVKADVRVCSEAVAGVIYAQVLATIRGAAFALKRFVDGALVTSCTLTASLPGPRWDVPKVGYLFDFQHGEPRPSWNDIKPKLRDALPERLIVILNEHLGAPIEPLSVVAERYYPIDKPPFFARTEVIQALL